MITINGLISARDGELMLIAGAGGADRLVTWAHVCDLPDPWSWVRPGDLLMTTGDGLPRIVALVPSAYSCALGEVSGD